MTFRLRTTDLRKLNSATKYPSIPTYHVLGPKGEVTAERLPVDGPVLLTEKVDGTNARIILTPDGEWVLGSRENLLAARGDLIGDPTMGIVEHLRATADRLVGTRKEIVVFYGELYGAKIGPGGNYTGEGRTGWRLFDVARLDFAAVAELNAEQIAQWREHGGYRWATEAELQALAIEHQLEVTPRLATDVVLPVTPKDTLAWLRTTLPSTLCALDDKAQKRPEGLVARTPDRSVIVKLRFEDYEKSEKRARQRQ